MDGWEEGTWAGKEGRSEGEELMQRDLKFNLTTTTTTLVPSPSPLLIVLNIYSLVYY